MSETSPAVRRRGAAPTHRMQLLFGMLYLALALSAIAFAAITWSLGRLNPTNALVFALVFVGTLPWAILTLRGDAQQGRNMDEGQREMFRAAMADALYVAYFGLYALFMAYIFVPAWQASAGAAVGVVLLLVMATWFGGYLLRRRG